MVATTYKKLVKRQNSINILSFIRAEKNRLDRLEKEVLKKIEIPVSVFSKNLGSLEAVVTYLRDNVGLTFSAMSGVLNRDERVLSVIYRKARTKGANIRLSQSDIYFVPANILRNKSLGVLESISLYLKENYQLSYKEAAVLLHRNERTVWTAVYKARGKLGK